MEFVDAHRDEFGVESICATLQVAPSSYYAPKRWVPSARQLRDQLMMPILLTLWARTGNFMGPTSCGRQPNATVTISDGIRSPA